MIGIVTDLIEKSYQDTHTDISSLAQHGDVIPLHPDYSPQWQKEAIIALCRLASLPMGWDSYGSPPPSDRALHIAERLVTAINLEDLPVPYIIPVSGGGIQIEWNIPPRELELEILPDGSVEYARVENDVVVEEGSLDPYNADHILSLLSWLTNVSSRSPG